MAAATYEMHIRLRRMWPVRMSLMIGEVFPAIGHWLVCRTLRFPVAEMRQRGKWVVIGHPGDDMICLER